jgi:hypothetical protein
MKKTKTKNIKTSEKSSWIERGLSVAECIDEAEKSQKVLANNSDFANAFSLKTDELGLAQLQYLFKADGLPIDIADPEYTIQAMIEGKIEGLSYISDLINHYMEEDPKIKKAVLPDVWNDCRKARQERLNEYNLSQSLNALASSSLRIFPLIALFDFTDLGYFKIIQDDCNDMVNFLKNVKKMSPVFLLILFSRINEIKDKFYYLIGYHRMKYEIRERYQNGPGAVSRESGETTIQRSIEVLVKCGGIDGYKNLPRGKKGEVRDAIEKKLNLKDSRHVYNILKKIENLPKTT